MAKEQDPHLLIVDDEDFILDVLKRQLKDRGYKILTASSGESALQLLKTHPVGVVVSDQSMPGMDGISFLTEVHKIDDGVVLIMLTGNGSLGHAVEAINELKVFSYIMKPWSASAMQTTIRDAFKHYEMNTAFRATMKRTYQLNEHLTKENAKLADHIKDMEAELERLKGARSQTS